ncbi:hypothetical protein E3N88_13443 [Mikania micrantha]|uniref:Uncharacterized protein n=1 Tax=Mikania micrantha TaxID=192012 RepID=A0A5N6PAC8_9ASTR|nr:hypothetical protein E3N88_13443 [Mikania micrantha]
MSGVREEGFVSLINGTKGVVYWEERKRPLRTGTRSTNAPQFMQLRRIQSHGYVDSPQIVMIMGMGEGGSDIGWTLWGCGWDMPWLVSLALVWLPAHTGTAKELTFAWLGADMEVAHVWTRRVNGLLVVVTLIWPLDGIGYGMLVTLEWHMDGNSTCKAVLKGKFLSLR